MIQSLGSDYGKHWVDLDLIPESGLIFSGGIGKDTTFDQELMSRKNCKVIGVDPLIFPTPVLGKGKFIYEQLTLNYESLLKLITVYGFPAVLKLDVEGAEYEILNSLKNNYIPQIAVEFHGALHETMQVVYHLRKIGYIAHEVMSDPYLEYLFIKEA